MRRCANAHLLLNEEDRSGAYCGAVYNFCAKTVALKASFIKKLCSMQQPTTPRDVERVFGLLNFGGQVLSAPVHKWFEAISWYRKLANALERGTVHRDELLRVPIPQQVQDELLQWKSFCLSNAPAVPPRVGESFSVQLFCDASGHGWGAVLCGPGGRILANGSRWTTPHISIDDAEAHAIVEALSTFQQEVQGNDVTILSDNAAVGAALTSGRTKSTAMAPHIRHAFEILSPMTWSVAKIDTRANPADEPSRGKDTIRQKALDAAHVQRWGLRRGISMSTECRIPVVT